MGEMKLSLIHKIMFVAIALFGAIACDTAPTNRQQAVESFSEFIVEFCSDKEFQMGHIRFPLGVVTGMITNEDIRTGGRTEVPFTQDLWLYLGASDFAIDRQIYDGERAEEGGFKYVTPTRIEFVRRGLIVEYLRSYTFEYVDGDWYVTEADFHNSGVDTYEDCVGEFARINAEKVLQPVTLEEFDLSSL